MALYYILYHDGVILKGRRARDMPVALLKHVHRDELNVARDANQLAVGPDATSESNSRDT